MSKLADKIEKVERWKCSDGKEYSSESQALGHENLVEEANEATQYLKKGYSVAEALRAIDRPVTDPILEKVTKDTKLVISYWQCMDTPGYQPCHFNTNGTIYCGGDAGSAWGSYGGDVDMKSLIRYASEKMTVL